MKPIITLIFVTMTSTIAMAASDELKAMAVEFNVNMLHSEMIPRMFVNEVRTQERSERRIILSNVETELNCKVELEYSRLPNEFYKADYKISDCTHNSSRVGINHLELNYTHYFYFFDLPKSLGFTNDVFDDRNLDNLRARVGTLRTLPE